MSPTYEKDEQLVARCAALPPTRTAIAHPCDESSLRGVPDLDAGNMLAFALPGEITERGVRRYRSQGLSYKDVASVFPRFERATQQEQDRVERVAGVGEEADHTFTFIAARY